MKILTLIAVMLLMAGCSGPEHVSAAEFKKEYAMVGQPQTVRIVAFLGIREGRAWLKVSSMPLVGSQWKENVIFVGLGELDADFRRSLPSGPIQPPAEPAEASREG